MSTVSIAAVIGILASGAFAQSLVVPHAIPDHPERMNACIAEWNASPARARGAMTYRQFTIKCVEGKTARPINAVAECRNGTTAPATTLEGACAYDGGVDRWLD